MKRKVLCFVLTLLAIAVFSIGCGGGGGHSNPASPVISGNAKVSGVVVDSNNKPVADAKVKLVLQSNNPLKSLPTNIANTFRLAVSDNTTEFNTTTDKNGVYSFSNVPYGRYSLSVDDGDQGAYLANINVSEDDTSVSGVTVSPFGSVTGTVKDDKGNLVYGAMVTAIERSAFTNENGQFTLTHIPLGAQNIELVTELQGYEATETTTFTIPVSNDNLTLTLDKPIILQPSVVNSYNVPVIVTAGTSTGTTGSSISYPVLIIAEDATDEKNFFFNVLKEGDASCTLRITKTGTYALTAIAYNRDEAKASNSLTVTKALIEGNVTSEDFTISFATSSSDDGIKVNIVKVGIDEEIGDATIDTVHSYDTYFDGNISCYSPSTGWFYKNLTNSSSDWTTVRNSEIFYDSINENNPILCGNSVAFFREVVADQDNSGYRIYWQIADGSSNALDLKNEKTVFDDNDRYVTPCINGISLIPGEFMCVAYNYLDPESAYCKIGLKAYTFNSSTSSQSGETQAVEPVLYQSLVNDVNDESKLVNDIRMAKDKNGNSYLAALCSVEGLKIYNISSMSGGSGATTINPIVTNTTLETWKFNNFQVYKDESGNLLFYIEGDNDGVAQTYIINSSSQIKYSDTESNKKSCYIDSKGSMYQYVPATETTSGNNEDSRKIIKITSPFDTNQSSATSTLDLVTGSLENENINGILGFNEDSSTNTLTIFVY